ncbi:NAD(P)-dependent dehydrogenase, short-chain alcohol dehydrogenase family [Amycolatopsis pretoriensis]|uniref:NAD(P)-dependent dehydrogenase, short-chain alcohol dehydrogenase family n=1 Tax=Amycolatopsis pretoriensis TaxID=218821 RepID=A0A1H5RIR9_9PSEU|nr:SDR family NAD(P)-dependent oxidoreductase [Amycolatopsis pretoriensis]SEF38170.1 NAD(P)-dependent dehydrogenase, short-chain alcohol dehydrogenase family [Amycolatopsis pretoriensis]
MLDTLLDRTVAVGYSRLGHALRRRTWAADDPAPDALRGRVALVTGASSGLGEATATGLARLGAEVVLVVRDLGRGEAALARVRAAVPGAKVRTALCDVASFASVRDFAARESHVDVLVHNAGVLPPERTESVDGHEVTFATHVLGPLLLTELLRPALRDARVIFVSSGGMYTQRLAVDDPEFREGRYRGATAYARTKRMQVELTPLLAERWRADGIAVHSTHPGWADTPGLADSLPAFRRLLAPALRTAEEGADTAVWLAATRPGPSSGRFWHDRRDRPTHVLPGTRPAPGEAERLLRYCLAAVGL